MTTLAQRAATHPLAGNLRPRRVPTAPSPDYVIDVSRPVAPFHWSSLVLAPIELLALAWSVPVIIMLLMAPVGLAIAIAFWVGRFVFGR
jgi:hypothetical protein